MGTVEERTPASRPSPGEARQDHREPPMEKDPLGAAKRKAYVASVVVSLPAMLVLWVTHGTGDPFVRVAFPLLALFCLACAWATWRRAIPVRPVELAMFVGVTGFAFAHLIHALCAVDDLADARAAVTETTYPTLTVLYVAAYLVFDGRAALRVSAAIYGSGLAIVLVKVCSELPGGLSPEEASWLVRMHGFMGAVIALIHASAHAKDQLARQTVAVETARRLAHTDPLTGVANRRRIYSELEKRLEGAKRYERPLSVIVFDLDRFKRINDTYGHDRGDFVLREVVRVTEPLLRKGDTLGRWGGEEFVVLAPETDLRQSGLLAERLREAIADHEFGSMSGVTASFGLAQYDEAGEGLEALIKRADEALYEAKATGRNRVEAQRNRLATGASRSS